MRQIALGFVFLSSLCLASLPAESELSFTKASLAFHEGKTDEANSYLDKLLASHPEEPQILELKALVQKTKGELEDSKKLYLKLFNKSKETKNFNKFSLYAFELGNIYFTQGHLDEAHRFLNTARKGNVNIEASEFLLGKIDFERQNWQESRAHFEAASKAEAFHSSSKLLIAQSYQKENLMTDALGAFVDAKESALADIAQGTSLNEQSVFLAQQVLKNSEQELRSFSKNQWIREVGLTTAYDSNVLFIPNIEDANTTSTTGSVKQSAHWRLRYASDPTARWQYLGAYQGILNYNFNRETEAGQFLVQDFSNFVTRGYLKGTQYGFKLGGTGTFQYQTTAYKPFSLSGSVGPFAKIKLNDHWSVGLEAFFQPNRNFLDPGLSESVRRSGWDQVLRAYVASRQNAPYWTPALFFTGTLLRPAGQDFSGTRLNVDFANAMYLSPQLFFAQTLGVSASRFPNRAQGERNDQGFSAAFSGGYQISNDLTLMAQLDYGQNFSSDSNFRFNRWTSSLSGNYRF
ncbi:MAG: tetratricopeptide repeat protein [Pseudomonadota bacterium]